MFIELSMTFTKFDFQEIDYTKTRKKKKIKMKEIQTRCKATSKFPLMLKVELYFSFLMQNSEISTGIQKRTYEIFFI